MLLPLAGLVVPIAFRRSLTARVIGIVLTTLAGTFSLMLLFLAHRLADASLHGHQASAEWQQGVDTMQATVNRPLPVLFVALVVLAALALMPYRAPQIPKGRPSV